MMSCWRPIAATVEPAAGTVATVFGGAPPDGGALADWDRACGASNPREAWSARTAEDRAALGPTGARVLHLPFVDAPYRTGPAPWAAITAALDELVQGFDEVWIPAAIGDHGDHALVAAVALQVSGGRRRRLYADLPYAALRGWSALVDAGRRGQHDDASLRAQLDASPFLPPSTVPLLSELSATEQAEKRQSLGTYSSQLPPLTAVFGRWFDDPSTARYELAWDPGPGPRPGRPVDMLSPAAAVPSHAPTPADQDRRGFLTVLVGTLGNRPEALAAALASLARQTCTDFEIVLLHHRPQRTGTEAVTPPWHPGAALPAVLIDRTRTAVPRGSPIRACRRVATPASIRSSTT